jgi:hypothetical protein
MPVSRQDRSILRELGKQAAEIAALPVQQQTIALWKALNSLKPVRPMVMIDQVCWNEMNVNDELTLRTEDEFCQTIEADLRRTLYSWKHMRADMVVEPVVTIPKSITGAGFGIEIEEERAVTDPTNEIVGHLFHDQLQTDEDLQKIRLPDARLDEVETARRETMAHEIFDGVLGVEMQGLAPKFNAWDWIVHRRGAGNVLMDLAERPDFMHRLIERVTEAALTLLDQAEERGLLVQRLSRIHCTGAYTDELPAPSFDPKKPRTKDLWTFGMAQIFGSVSPAMHKEFDLDYAVRFYERFGLVYYGCCEPLHLKLDMVKKIPNLRKISMSPWVDVEKGAEQIGRDFVFSRKPSPALLAGSSWHPDAVEADLRDVVTRCAHHGCPVELILKDISTVGYQPQRLWEWEKIAMRVAGAA